ncbi:MAG: hypothetical protein C6P37_05085 [Caldibacillus debilis]|uniref:Uncharacterized protein n=1 Tax=Caldibacillus debilis TaxID=301148 RepID=A0A3E0K6K5_9BACI|nr:hypothetical protein [Bacillaceae bacterium]OUM84572.1 MAG: hypothetical protein BAA03_00905 [Caldibacillus debilis]REJ15800.1 MAG: hypothetical protein C6W57_10065 [Caldibacillus debilis]REJ27931.1 MAG: hypothetical protein C6W56_09515 [Caldibacillus debilis]REJ29334.1 MAG: hypothetical protein C6P37_05085 [Caldibacillus debilis]
MKKISAKRENIRSEKRQILSERNTLSRRLSPNGRYPAYRGSLFFVNGNSFVPKSFPRDERLPRDGSSAFLRIVSRFS